MWVWVSVMTVAGQACVVPAEFCAEGSVVLYVLICFLFDCLPLQAWHAEGIVNGF